jgi:hypothetical protein
MIEDCHQSSIEGSRSSSQVGPTIWTFLLVARERSPRSAVTSVTGSEDLDATSTILSSPLPRA